MPDWYARGYTPAGVEVWNVIRALDYLETRPEVDKSRFGITGRSGGAAMSWFSAAVDSRLKVAVPVMGNSTYAANVAANTQKGHCDCMFPINTYQHDLMTQGALIAPRPLHMMHGKQDTLFPVPGYEEFEAKDWCALSCVWCWREVQEHGGGYGAQGLRVFEGASDQMV